MMMKCSNMTFNIEYFLPACDEYYYCRLQFILVLPRIKEPKVGNIATIFCTGMYLLPLNQTTR